MSQKCKLTGYVINCTDNCDACVKEEAKKMDALILSAWEKDHFITFHLNHYLENNNLYVGMLCHDDGYPEPWSDLTVNLSIKCDDDCAFIDTNNNGEGILLWLTLNNIAMPTGRTVQNGFWVYPEVKFNMFELMKYVSSN